MSVAVGLRLLQSLDFGFDVVWIATVFTDSDFDLTMLHKKLTEFSATFSHDVKQILGDDTFVSDGTIPDDGSDSFGNALGPKFTNPGRRF